MAGVNNTGQNSKFYNLKTKATKELSPYFGLQEKVDGSWKITKEFNAMQGMLSKAEIVEKEYEGKKRNVFIITIDDGTETSLVNMEHSQVAYSFFNSLAKDCNTLDTYSFEVWKKESGGKFYANGGLKVKLNGKFEKVEWSIDPKSTPQAEPVMVNGVHFENNGQKMYDSSKQKAFWEQLFRDKIIAKLAAAAPTSHVNTTATNTAPTNQPAANANISAGTPENDDLPW